MDVEIRDATIRATDRANNVFEIETVGWDQPAPDHWFDFAYDAIVSGRVTRLSAETPHVSIRRRDGDGDTVGGTHVGQNERHDLEQPGDGAYQVFITERIATAIAFGSGAVVEKRGDADLEISFRHPTPVSIAFQESASVPNRTVTVPETPEGVATALSQFSARFSESDPGRSSILSQGHPPRIEFGDETAIPAEIASATGVDGIELTVPPTLEALLPVASLATYLGAEVTVDADRPPTLSLQSVGVTRELSAPPTLQYDAAATLRRVFHLDALARQFTGHPDWDWLEADALSVLDLDLTAVADRPLPERVARYLSVDFEAVASIFPEWTANVYAEPTYESVQALPYLVYHLTQVYLPDAVPTNRPDRTDQWDRRRVERLHGGRRRHGPRPKPHGPYVGYLGDDAPPGPYHVTTAALRHRENYLGDHESASVTVAGGPAVDRETLADRSTLYEVDPAAVDASILAAPTTGELSERIESGTDLLHYVGPCRDGLACENGRVRPGDLDGSLTRTFVLEGAGGRSTGLELLDAGSVAGAVWDAAPEAEVRDSFVRLFVGGMTADFAARIARDLAAEDSSLAVLGDGFHELLNYQEMSLFPMWIDPVGDRQFRVRISPWFRRIGSTFGGLCLERWQFGGNQFDLTLSASDVAQLLDTTRYMVIYDGDLYYPEELTPFDPAI